MKLSRIEGRPAGRSAGRRLGALAGAVALGAFAGTAAAVEGPVIVGGDNLLQNGSVTSMGTGTLQGGWLAAQRELEWVAPKVGRANDNSVAALGVQDSNALTGDAGAAIKQAGRAAGMPVRHYEGAAEISGFFADLRTARVKPRVIWLPGNRAANSMDTAERTAVDADRATLASYMAGGGGLIAHGDATVYSAWLQDILPGLEAYAGSAFEVNITPEGAQVFTGLGPSDMDDGLWWNAFRGNLNGLQVLLDSPTLTEAPGVPRKIILGGGRAWSIPAPANLRVRATADTLVDRGDTFDYKMTVTNDGPNLAAAATLTHVLPNDFAFRGAVATQGACTAGQTVTCALGDIGVGQSVRVRVQARALKRGTRRAVTEVAQSVPDPNPADNRATRTTRVALAGLRVKVRAPAEIAAGAPVTVRVAVTNKSTRLARNVIVRSPIPKAFVLTRRPAGGRVENGAAVWDIGTIRPGRTRVVVFYLRNVARTSATRCIPGHVRASNINVRSGRTCPFVRGR